MSTLGRQVHKTMLPVTTAAESRAEGYLKDRFDQYRQKLREIAEAPVLDIKTRSSVDLDYAQYQGQIFFTGKPINILTDEGNHHE